MQVGGGKLAHLDPQRLEEAVRCYCGGVVVVVVTCVRRAGACVSKHVDLLRDRGPDLVARVVLAELRVRGVRCRER